MKILQAVRLLLALVALACAACSARGDANANANPNAPSAQTPLRGTEWALVEISGKALAATGGRPPTLTLAADGSRASGFAGCNQFSGAYTASSDTLQLTSMALTRMFCNETMDLEKQYMAALESVRTYRVNGTRLELLSDGKVVAAFEKR